jgi:uncharacterized protein
VPRFLCDEMLRGLFRWLRAAGYDTIIDHCRRRASRPGTRRALRRRGSGLLLTKDRRLATTVTGTTPVVLLPGDGIDETARAWRIALDIDWQHAPFTRCIVDNRPLAAAPPYLATRVPVKVTGRRRSIAGVPRMLPPLLAGRPCPPDAAAACCLATGGGPTQLTDVSLAAAGERGGGKSAPQARGMEWPRAPAAVVSRREQRPGALWAGQRPRYAPSLALLSGLIRPNAEPDDRFYVLSL